MRLVLVLAPLVGGCFALHPSRGGGQIDDLAVAPRVPSVGAVAVTQGYVLDVVANGLDFPTGVGFDDDGGVYLLEAGYSYGEVFTTARLLRVEPDGATTEVASGDNGPWTGLAFHDGGFFVSEGGVQHGGRIVRIGLDGSRTVLVDGLPSLGDHHTNGPVVHDGWVYFGQGTATNASVVGPDNADFGWLARHPDFHDVPCRDVVLAGHSYRSRDAADGKRKLTGPYLPYGTPASEGQVIPGATKCNGAVLRMRPDGTELEVVGWGFRNPFGLAVAPDGAIYVTDNGYDVRGSRPVFGAGDWLWRLEPGTWYGWPDYVGGLALGPHRWKSPGHPKPEPVLAQPPSPPPKPIAVFGVHSSADGFDFSRSADFGYVGDAFVALFGDQAKGVGKVEAPVGFKVVRVEVETGVIHDFAVNRGQSTGPGTWLESSGLERPLAVRFDPEGTSLYVVDFGVLRMDGKKSDPSLGTGTLWRVRPVPTSDARVQP